VAERSVRSSTLLLTARAALAAANLAAGAVISSWPERQVDLQRVARWARLWLEGVNLYGAPDEYVDYPPHAIVLLAPLGLVTERALVPLWAAANLLLAGAAVYLAVRAVRPAGALRVLAAPMLMLLCWGGFRALLQFSLLAIAGGLAAVVWADRRPFWSAACLAIALAKPQIAAPFVLWMVFARRWRHAAAAIGVVLLGFGVYCLRAGVSPVLVASDYYSILRVLYTGPDPMEGLGQVRALLATFITDPATADALAIGLAAILLGGIVWLGMTGPPPPDGMSVAFLLAPVWSLLTFYHLTYGFLLLLPTAATLLLCDDARTRGFRHRLFWAMQLGLMFDVVTVWRWTGPALGAATADEVLVEHVDRLLMLALAVALAVLAFERRTPERRTTH
jgi:hypothetical protein